MSGLNPARIPLGVPSHLNPGEMCRDTRGYLFYGLTNGYAQIWPLPPDVTEKFAAGKKPSEESHIVLPGPRGADGNDAPPITQIPWTYGNVAHVNDWVRVQVQAIDHNGDESRPGETMYMSFLCVQEHEMLPNNLPNTGAYWETYWQAMARDGYIPPFRQVMFSADYSYQAYVNDWLAVPYLVGDPPTTLVHEMYFCCLKHESTADTLPPTGADWQDYWWRGISAPPGEKGDTGEKGEAGDEGAEGAMGQPFNILQGFWSGLIFPDARLQLAMPMPGTLDQIDLRFQEGPLGANFAALVLWNGTNIGSITVLDGETTGSAVPVQAMAQGDIITLLVTSVGTTQHGSDMLMACYFTWSGG